MQPRNLAIGSMNPAAAMKSRRQPARESFERKLAMLEAAVAEQRLPAQIPKMKTLQDFQNWREPEQGLVSWSNTSILRGSGPNADLRSRLDEVWPTIQLLQGRTQKTRSKQKSQSERLWEAQVRALNVQVFKLIVERDEAIKNVNLLTSANASMETELERREAEILELRTRRRVVTLFPSDRDV